MKKFLLLILSLVNAAVTAIYLAVIPKNSIPIHYGIGGVADAYGSKWIHMLGALAIIVVAAAYLVFCTVFERRNKTIKNEKYLFKIVCGTMLLLCTIYWIITIISINGISQIGDAFPAAALLILGMFMVFIGNMLPKFKQNSFLGIKTFATLNSESVWKKTHRLGGYLGVIGGILLLILGILGFAIKGFNANMVLFGIGNAICLVTVALIPAIYANCLYRKEKKGIDKNHI